MGAISRAKRAQLSPYARRPVNRLAPQGTKIRNEPRARTRRALALAAETFTKLSPSVTSAGWYNPCLRGFATAPTSGVLKSSLPSGGW